MAKKTTTEATVTTAVEKVSIKDKILNSVPAKKVKANWKPFTAGFGTAAGLGLVTGIILKLKGIGEAETMQDMSESDTDSCNEETVDEPQQEVIEG